MCLLLSSEFPMTPSDGRCNNEWDTINETIKLNLSLQTKLDISRILTAALREHERGVMSYYDNSGRNGHGIPGSAADRGSDSQ